MWLGTTGSFSRCVNELTNSARRALFSLRSYFAKNREILPSVQLKLFNSMVLPILFYGSEVWGVCKADPMETFYMSFLKSILRVKLSTTNIYVYGEFGLVPLHVQRKVRVLKYWAKLVDGSFNENSYVFKVYKALYNLSVEKPRTVTWATLVRKVLDECGMIDYWDNQKVDCKVSFERLAKQKLWEGYITKWKEDIADSTDGRIFRYIKEDFKFEKYLELGDRRLREAISKVRMSSHLFYIERGRWGKPIIERVDRLCDVCNVIEDEKHCLLECPKYVNERRERLPEWLRMDPSWDNFVRFFKSEDDQDIRMLGLLCKSVQAEHRRYLTE